MKNSLTKYILVAATLFTLNACSTTEERATIVKDADSSTTNNSSSTDSLKSAQGKLNSGLDTGQANSGGDSSNNNKMESFRHVPIDTITNIDTMKH